MRYDCVLFDLDGTLLNTLDDLTDAMNHALTALDMPARTLDEVRAFVGNGVGKLVERATGGERVGECRALFQEYYGAHMQDKTRPYPGVVDAMRALDAAGVRCAVVSNKYDAAVRVLCDRFFGSLARAAVGEGEGVAKKPAPDGALKAMRLLDADPAKTLYVGDSDVDVATAKNAHLPCAGVSWGFRPRETLIEAGAVAVFDTAEALRDFILGA